MARNFILGTAALILFGLSAAGARGQDSLLDELYGRGVHAYFSRDFKTAKATLTSAIEGGSRDPRAYYFRGLTSLAIGKQKEADADFKTGAAFEVNATERAYAVARSLERIQGAPRRMLEVERQTARVVAAKNVAAKKNARYEQFQANEPRVLRGGMKAPAGGAAGDGPMPGKDPDDPFAEEPGAVPGKEPAAEPVAPGEPVEPSADPPAVTPAEGDDPPPAKKPAAADDPFGEEAPAPKAPAAPAGEEAAEEEMPAEPAAPAKKPAAPAPDDDPFAEAKPAAKKGGGILGSMMKAVGKSLPGEAGGAAGGPVAPAIPAAPAGAKPPADDPFADDPAPPAPAPPKAPAKAPAKPAAPADDDPFK